MFGKCSPICSTTSPANPNFVDKIVALKHWISRCLGNFVGPQAKLAPLFLPRFVGAVRPTFRRHILSDLAGKAGCGQGLTADAAEEVAGGVASG